MKNKTQISIEEQPRTLKFKCPKCDGTQLEEVQLGMIVTSRIETLRSDGRHNYAANPDITGDADITYQCFECGDAIPRTSSPEELSEFLMKQKYNKERK